jgi:outer membrane protein assembly factor BamD
MGDKFETQQVTAYQRIVKDYPLSIHAEDARAQLEVMKRTVPEADTVAMARMKFEMENRTKPGKMSNFWGLFRSRPDMSQAAKSGTPPMEGYRPTIPASVPPAAANPGALGTNDVSISVPGGDSEIDKGKEVRANPTGAPAEPAAPPAAAPNTAKPAADPNDAVKQASMTPAQQKKEYNKQLKQQQDAVKKSQVDRKKKEAELQARIKEQKKKSRARQDEQKQEQKQPPAPAATGGQAPPPPDKP